MTMTNAVTTNMSLVLSSSRTGAIGIAVALLFLLPALPHGECAFLFQQHPPTAPTTTRSSASSPTSALLATDHPTTRVKRGGRNSNSNSSSSKSSRSRDSTGSSVTGLRNRRVFSANDDDTSSFPGQRHQQLTQEQQQQPQLRQASESSSSSINCPHFGECPGCITDTNVSNIDIIQSARLYFSSSSVKRYINAPTKSNILHHTNNEGTEDEFYKIRIPTPITHWRTQAKLAIGPPTSSSKSRILQSGISVGLYRRNSHNILSIPQCQVHHPNINVASSLLSQAAQNVRITPYNEFDGRGLLRYAQFRVETTTGKVSLTLVMNVEKLKECQPQLSRLVKELQRLDAGLGGDDGQGSERSRSVSSEGDDEVDYDDGVGIISNNNSNDNKPHQGRIFHSIWVHCNDSEGNAIFARDISKWHPIFGPRYVREPIPGSSSSGGSVGVDDDGDEGGGDGYLYFAPYVFRQGNIDGFTDIAKEVSMAIPSGSKVCELYAGVGLLGLSRKTIFVRGVSAAIIWSTSDLKSRHLTTTGFAPLPSVTIL